MKKGDKAKKVLGLVVVFLIVIVSLFVGVVSAEAIIIDTEKGESGFWTEPARNLPANWWYARDHPDTSADGWFDTNAYPPGQGNGSFWYTISFPGMDECKGIWETSLPHSGEYEVFAWIPSPDHFDPYLDESTPPSDYLPTKRAQYKVFHNNGVTTVTIDQNEGGFTSFGIFDFDNTARVELSSNGVEFWRSVAFDAVKFVPTTKGIPEGTLREVDVVKHLEWAGPEGTQPDTYAEYREGRKYEIGPVAPIPWSKEDIFVQVCVLKDLPQDAEYEAIKGIPSTIAVYHFYLKDPKIAGSGVFEKVDSISLTKINESTYCGSKLIKKWSGIICIGYPSTNYIDGKSSVTIDQSKETSEVTVHYWESTRPPIPANSSDANLTGSNGINAVRRLEWAGPEGTKPDTHAEYIAGREYEGKKEPIMTLGASSRYIILVDNVELLNNIRSELERYRDEVIATGYDAEIWGYETGSPSPEDIRWWLQTQQPITGCLLIGDLSSAWYELDSKSWPIDLFFMDLNGIWTDSDLDGIYDSHTGDVAPEIFVARLKSDNLFLGGSTEVDLLKNYFDKNHNYRLGLINQPKRGLMYVDDDWVHRANNWNAALGLVYDHTTLVKDEDTTIDTDYENRLSQGYEWIQVCAHSWPGGHHFKNTAGWDGYTYNSEIKSIDPDALFYNLFACSATRFTMDDYLGGWYIFTNTYGLTAVGSTKSGSMLEFDHFYRPLAQGNTVGDAFLQWFKEVGVTDVYWFYGMNILGDPLLKQVSDDIAIFRNGVWCVDTTGNHVADLVFGYGIPGDVPIVGNFGSDDIAIFRNGMWCVDTTGNHIADLVFGYGIPGDIPLVGDIDQDGTDDIAIFRNGMWCVDTTGNHIADLIFGYGIAGDVPLVGDINKDGTDDIAIFRNGIWCVDTTGNNVADLIFGYGLAGDVPLVGDINQDGTDDIAIFRNGMWCVDTTGNHVADLVFGYGIPGDVPLVGDIG